MIRKGKIWLPVAMIATILWALPRMLPAVSFDSGLMEHSQPNAVTFQSRAWGNEFTWEHETADGYSIIDKAADGYWYYSVLDINGDYAPSSYKVGIDAPVGIEKHLRRTDPILSIINAQIDSFNQLCEDQSQEYWASLSRDDIYLGVILVEFPDVGPNHRQCLHNTSPEYTFAQYYEHFNSIGTYYTELNPSITSPDGDPVFGSQRDYWTEVSRGNATMYTTIINNIVGGVPQWLSYPNNLPNECAGQNYSMNGTVWNWAVDYCAEEGMIPINTQYICIVGAGNNWYYEPGLGWHLIGPVGGLGMPSAFYNQYGLDIIGGFTCHEKWSWWGTWFNNPQLWNKYFQTQFEPYEWLFTNIGEYCHEAGHGIFGWGHITPTHEWDLMESGTCGGLGYTCSCPTHPDPVLLIEKNWVTPTVINSNQMNFTMTYDETYNTPNIYMVAGTQPSNPYQDYFVFENRRYVAFNKFAPGNPDEYSPPNPENNLLVWQQKNLPSPGGNHSYLHLQMANNGTGLGAQPEGCVFPGATGRNHLLPTYADLFIHDSRSCGYGALWEGFYQDGTALKEITSDDEEDWIKCDLYRNYWEGTLGLLPLPSHTIYPQTTNATWSGTDVVVGGDVIVPDGFTLTISPGSVISFEQGGRIRVEAGGQLIAQGTSSQPIVFQRRNPTLNWIGIELFGTGQGDAQFDFCTISGANTALNSVGGSFDMSHCTLSCNADGIVIFSAGDVSISHCTIENSSIIGLQAYSSLNIDIAWNTVHENLAGGIALFNCSGVELVRNFIRDNGSSSYYGGLYLDMCSPRMEYNYIEYNSGKQLIATDGSFPIMNQPAETGGINTMSTLVAVHYPIYVIHSFPLMDLGHNNAVNQSSNSTILIYDNSPNPSGHRNIRRNFWGTANPQSTQFYPSSVQYIYNPFDLEFNNPPPGGDGLCSLEEDTLQMLFSQACQLEQQGSFQAAIGVFQSIAENFPDSLLALASLGRISDCAVEGGYDLDEFAEYFVSLSNLPLNEEFCSRAFLSSISTKIHAAEYFEAISDCEDILLSSPPLQDSILAVIDAGMAYLLAELGGGQGACGFGETGYEGRIPPLNPGNLAEYYKIIANLWGMAGSEPGTGSIPDLPVAYRLYQNAPNPFNYATVIRFALPQAGRVKLDVFDLAGRLVGTLVNGERPAGYHQVTWDASKLPSGIYFCRVEAGSFTAVKKMILIK